MCHATLYHSTLLRATGGTFPLHFAKSFLRALTLLFLCYFRDLSCPSHPLNIVTFPMDNIDNVVTLDTLWIIMTPSAATSVRRRARTITSNMKRVRMTWHQGVVKLAMCGKIESSRGDASVTGVNSLRFFVSVKLILDGRVCNSLIIFITPHYTHPRIYHFIHRLTGRPSVPGCFLPVHFLLGPGWWYP